jgi:hypothetical protein
MRCNVYIMTVNNEGRRHTQVKLIRLEYLYVQDVHESNAHRAVWVQ